MEASVLKEKLCDGQAELDGLDPQERHNPAVPEPFRNYRGPIKIAGSGFPGEKTTKVSVYTNCETAILAIATLLPAVDRSALLRLEYL